MHPNICCSKTSAQPESTPVAGPSTSATITRFASTSASIKSSIPVMPSTESSDSDVDTYKPSQFPTKANKQSYRIMDAFEHVNAFSEGGQRYAAINNCLLYLICRDKRPFHIVNGQGFCRLMKLLASAYKIPSASKLKKLLDEKYVSMFYMYKEKLKHINFFSVTCDVWSDMMTCKSFLGVTLHYLEERVLESSVIATRELTESHTSQYLGQQLIDILTACGFGKHCSCNYR